MRPAEAHIWSCQRRQVKGTRLANTGRAWRLMVSLDCGHEATQDFAYPDFSYQALRNTASDLAHDRALRAEANIKRVGTAPCLACGPTQ